MIDKTVSMKTFWRRRIASEFFRQLNYRLHTDYRTGMMRRNDKGISVNSKTRWYISELELRKLQKKFKVENNDFKMHNLSE